MTREGEQIPQAERELRLSSLREQFVSLQATLGDPKYKNFAERYLEIIKNILDILRSCPQLVRLGQAQIYIDDIRTHIEQADLKSKESREL
jgi:hypothetical protein